LRVIPAARAAPVSQGTPASREDPLLVHYHANISKAFDVNGVDTRNGYWYDSRQPNIVEYEQGSR
jgi:hypothetical protein